MSRKLLHIGTLKFLLEVGHVFDLRRSDAAAAKHSDVGELVEVGQGDAVGQCTAHREAGHGAVRLIGQRPVVGVDKGNHFSNEHVLEWRVGHGESASAWPSASSGSAGRRYRSKLTDRKSVA